ncbi:unnamed protein product [Ectocarpus sp. 8 AP-2014]
MGECTDSSQIKGVFENHRPRGTTDLAKCLKEAMEKYAGKRRIDANVVPGSTCICHHALALRHQMAINWKSFPNIVVAPYPMISVLSRKYTSSMDVPSRAVLTTTVAVLRNEHERTRTNTNEHERHTHTHTIDRIHS